MIQVIECDQGSPEWFAARAGCTTASMFSTIRKKVGMPNEQQQKYIDAMLSGKSEAEAKELAGYKCAPKAAVIDKALSGEPVGDWSDAAKTYAFRLAIERISGEPLDDSMFETYHMRRGRELEEECRIRHESHIGELVDLAGFVHTEDRKFGCSADSLIGDHGGAEYKCFIAPDKLRAIVIDNDWGDIMDQVQGCLWLTGRQWWDSCLYCPALANAGKDFLRVRHERDDDYISALEADLIAFDQLVTDNEKRLRSQ